MEIPVVVKITFVILMNLLGITFTTLLFLSIKDMSNNKEYVQSVINRRSATGATGGSAVLPEVSDKTYVLTENNTKLTFFKVVSILFLYVFTKNMFTKLNILTIVNVLISFGLLFTIIMLFSADRVVDTDDDYIVELDSIRYNYILVTMILLLFMFSLNILVVAGLLAGADVEYYIGLSYKIIPEELTLEPIPLPELKMVTAPPQVVPPPLVPM